MEFTLRETLAFVNALNRTVDNLDGCFKCECTAAKEIAAQEIGRFLFAVSSTADELIYRTKQLDDIFADIEGDLYKEIDPDVDRLAIVYDRADGGKLLVVPVDKIHNRRALSCGKGGFWYRF